MVYNLFFLPLGKYLDNNFSSITGHVILDAKCKKKSNTALDCIKKITIWHYYLNLEVRIIKSYLHKVLESLVSRHERRDNQRQF